MRLLFGRRRNAPFEAAADRLHDGLIAQIRQPDFYLAYGVPDTFEGRFDLLVLHVGLVLRRLRGLGPDGQALGQALVDTLFARFDVAMRELGVSDIGVPKRMKRLAEAFKGRVAAYDDALRRDDSGSLTAAIGRNVLDGRGEAEPLARYATAAAAVLDELPLSVLMDGALRLPSPTPLERSGR